MTRPPDLDLWRHKLAGALASNSEGHPAAAQRAFSQLLKAIQASGDTRAEALLVLSRVHLGLATSTFDQRGDVGAALRHIGLSEALAREAGAPHVLVAALGQRGLLHLRSGDTAAALTAFDSAADLLDQAEPFDQTRILLNRGALHLERGALGPARRDLSRCVTLAVTAEDHVMEFMARHNLGYVEFLAGNLPRALAEMAAAAGVDSGGPWPTALLDQARVLREAGLNSEADQVLMAAESLYLADRIPQGAGEAELVRAECALATSSPGKARVLASRARSRFRRRGNVRWERKAEHLILVAELAMAALAGSESGSSTGSGIGPPRRLRSVATRAGAFADTCESEDRVDLARSARLLQADALLAAGIPESMPGPQPWLNLSRQDPIAIHLQVRHVRARAALAAGDRATSRSEVRRGLAEVRAYQGRFGSLDMRTASAVHGVALARLDFEIALGSGRPSAVFASIERTRAASSRLSPVQPPQDNEAASLLAELRQVEEEARGLEGSAGGTDLTRLRNKAAELRSAVRASAWRREGTRNVQAVREVVSLNAIRTSLDNEDYALVSIVSHGGRCHAALVDGRRVEHHVLGSVEVADELVRRIGSDLDALALPMIPEQIRVSVRRSLQAGLAALDAMVLWPLNVEGRNLVVSSSGSLAMVPWGLLPSRRGLPVVVSPSASSWFEAADRTTARLLTQRQTQPKSHPPVWRVASVAGPGLTRADAEARAIARTWSGTAMTGPGASTGAVTRVLGTHDVVHIAAHGRHEPENPLFSSLRLVDGPLFAHELDSSTRMASCVVLSACEVGLSTWRPGNEALGLTNVLLQLGARSVLAGVARVADDVAAQVMEHMHQLMAAGVDSAAALAQAQVEAGRDEAASPFVCFGSTWAASALAQHHS